ncbi:MAG TPA: hypothetical protein VJ983_08610 [candidate division Zixibacteria bacterium]|nr:hypothetical protein [candidate division Zixibacteria bacterium]
MLHDNDYKLLIQALGGQILGQEADVNPALKALVDETLKFRDKLMEDTGETLTVDDTRVALEALEGHLQGKKFPKGLTPEQKALAQILIDRIILFKLQ